VTVKRYSYSVPASGVLDLIPLDRPMVLAAVCALVAASAAPDSAKLEVLNGEGNPVFSASAFVYASPAAPFAIQFAPGIDNNLVQAFAVPGPLGAQIPPALVVLPGETVRLSFASGMVFSSVVVTWRELE